MKSVWYQLWDHIINQDHYQIGQQVHDQTWIQVWDQLFERVGSKVRIQVLNYCQHPFSEQKP